MSGWTEFLSRKKRDDDLADEFDPDESQSDAYLSDILGTIEAIHDEQEQFHSEALELLRGMLEELQSIQNSLPAFHEGVSVALELRREIADEEAQKVHDEMVDAEENGEEV